MGEARRKVSPLILVGSAAVTGVVAVLAFQTLDRAAQRTVQSLREPLERSISESLGHPIRFGPYDGLRPWGFAVGASKVAPVAGDRSTIQARGVSVHLDPLASLQRWQPVLRIRLDGLSATLDRQPDGRYWRFGSPAQGGDPPPELDLRFELTRAAEVLLQPTNERLLLDGRGSVLLGQGQFSAATLLRWTDQPGRLNLQVNGRWDRPELVVSSRLRAIELNRLASLVPLPDQTDLAGRADGDLNLQWTPAMLRCGGGVRLKGLKLDTPGLASPLQSPSIGLTCRGERLQLARSRFSSGDWFAQAQGSVDLNKAFDLRIDLGAKGRQDRAQVLIDGPWANPRWRLEGSMVSPALEGPLQLRGQLRTPWTDPEARQIRVEDALVQAPGLRLRFGGVIDRQVELRSRELSLGSRFWRSVPGLHQILGESADVAGGLQLSGPLASPLLKLDLAQVRNPLLQRWDLSASWSWAAGVLALNRFDSPALRAEGRLPLAWRDGSLQVGDLMAGFALQELPLARLAAVTEVPLQGTLSARGQLQGPLNALRPDVALDLNRPGAGPLRMPERWQGRLAGDLSTGLTIGLVSGSSASPAALKVLLAADGWPTTVDLERGGGVLRVRSGQDRQLQWIADRLSLDGIQLALSTETPIQPVRGRLSGDGSLRLQPLQLKGAVRVDDPTVQGVALKQIELDGQLIGGRYQAQGRLQPEQGEIQMKASGRLNAELRSRFEATAVDVPWLLAVARQLRGDDTDHAGPVGLADDLGTLVIDTFGGSLDGHLQALAMSRQAVEAYDLAHPRPGAEADDLDGRLDAVVTLFGPDVRSLFVEADARAHLWVDGEDKDQMLQMEPLVAQIKGPLQGGEGRFSLLHLPFSLLGLVAPLPSALRGAIGAKGVYDLSGQGPLLTLELDFEQVSFGGTTLVLERRQVELSNTGVKVDLALRGSAASETVQVRGLIPLSLRDELELDVESHGDALGFLASSAGDALSVKRGSSDLRLMLRGYLDQPQANGFLVVRNGELKAGEQTLRRINTSLVFDFNRVEVSRLEATLASGGTLTAAGAVGLFVPREEVTPLTIRLSKGKLRQSIVDVSAEGEVTVEGALNRPLISGQLNLSKGMIQPRGGLLSRLRRGLGASQPRGVQTVTSPPGSPVPRESLLEESWDYSQPLVLFGPGVASPVSKEFQDALPNLPAVRFRNFRLGLGPDLQVQMPPLISFRGGGQLLINGPLDPSLQLRGLIRLNRGRLSLFSTTFRLDSKAPNVAVFTPSLGLIPYVDIAMKTRVSDSVQTGENGASSTSNVFDLNGLGSMGDGGGSLRLVKVTVQATGPADRLLGNLDLRSSPPMSEAQLLSMIGGNSLSGLAGAGGAALATVLGQSLLSPVIGTLSDAMGQRLQIALFPTYITPEVKDAEERTSGRVPPKFTLVTEIGVDVSDRFDFSVLAAPNTTDVPPQATVTYQLNPNTALSGSVNSNGTWQSQLQVFFRF